MPTETTLIILAALRCNLIYSKVGVVGSASLGLIEPEIPGVLMEAVAKNNGFAGEPSGEKRRRANAASDARCGNLLGIRFPR